MKFFLKKTHTWIMVIHSPTHLAICILQGFVHWFWESHIIYCFKQFSNLTWFCKATLFWRPEFCSRRRCVAPGHVRFGQTMMWSWIISIWAIAEVRVSLISLWSQQCKSSSEHAFNGVRLLLPFERSREGIPLQLLLHVAAQAQRGQQLNLLWPSKYR